jgi:pyrimidine-specific ribonucleoside hydrolase
MRPLRLVLSLCFVLAAQAQHPILIDTDAGTDDLMAIAFLVSHPDIRIDAITVVNGLAHSDAGAKNIVRLLDLAGRQEIPVFAGRGTPLRGKAEFPAEWRKISDDLPGVALPAPSRQPESKRAADYLVERLRDQTRPVRILALGPLTNLAEALKREPSLTSAITELVIMGGALRVPGNLGDGGVFKTNNTTAEWNMFVDPLAARIVFRSGVPIRLIPLDATNKVLVDSAFLAKFQAGARSPLARVVAQVLESDRAFIEAGFFYAWDPLAAVALLHPAVVNTTNLHIDIRQDPPEEGRTIRTPGRPNARVALDADGGAWRKLFFEALDR